MKSYDVVSICNALVDIIFDASDEDLKEHNLTKGNMHLVDRSAQEILLSAFKGKSKGEELGGSAMNAMRALARLGKKTCFAGMVAEDHFGGKIKKRLGELSINGHLNVTKEEATGTCMVLVTPDGERTMVTYLGASRLYNSSHIPHKELTDADYFHFCGYQWDTEGQKKGILEAIKIAKDANTIISFDLADPFVVNNHKNDFLEIIKDHADIVFANKEEAHLLWGTEPKETAKVIASQGATAVIKLGSEGALIRKDDKEVKVSPISTQVVDTTAAGDMFAAGFLYGQSNKRPLDECGRIAATLASDVISRYGASLSQEAIDLVR
ncbi:MAG: adenosine kinase [Oligoflexales bacterium]